MEFVSSIAGGDDSLTFSSFCVSEIDSSLGNSQESIQIFFNSSVKMFCFIFKLF